MIRHVEIKNFKSHKDTKLDFSNLTVLCGTNSSGKSSVIQALLLLREGWENSPFRYLNLKTDTASIGTAQDALYQFSDVDKISFVIKNDLNETSELHFEIIDFTKTIIPISNESQSEECPFDFLDYQYISASRFGPQTLYPKDDMIDIFNQISKINGQAEYVVQFLDKRRYKDVIPDMCLPEYGKDLLTQVTAWEREIASGISVFVEDKGQLGYELKYQFNTEQGKTDKFNAVNVGFGLTYALPVIVAILSANPSTILFIENPESHLHPKGQTKLAELICLAAQAGVQIVVETHSDHIFNGIRKAISQKKIKKEKVKVHYFDLIDSRTSDSKEIQFSDTGRILNYTEGLFDQFDNDLDELLGL